MYNVSEQAENLYKMNNERKKHMTLADRIEIRECLSKGMTFKSIAKRIGKSPTTVSNAPNFLH